MKNIAINVVKTFLVFHDTINLSCLSLPVHARVSTRNGMKLFTMAHLNLYKYTLNIYKKKKILLRFWDLQNILSHQKYSSTYVEIQIQLEKELKLIIAHRARPEKFAKLKLQFSLFVRGELRMRDKQQATSRPFQLDDIMMALISLLSYLLTSLSSFYRIYIFLYLKNLVNL